MESGTDEIPAEAIPLFPLPSGVLFPGVLLPLHVFEQRYRRMAHEILERPPERRRLVVGLLRPGFEHLYHTRRAPIYPVVCLARVIHCKVVDEGRYNLLALGCCRATVTSEDRRKCFRRASVCPAPRPASNGHADDLRMVAPIARLICEARRREMVNARLIEQLMLSARSAEHLLDCLAFHLIPARDAVLKQRILEEPDVHVRAHIFERWLLGRTARPVARDASFWPPPSSWN